MISQKYLSRLKKIVRKHFPREETKFFVFGSAIDTRRKNFYDVVGISGDSDDKEIGFLNDELEESNFPYIIDIVNFNTVNAEFKEYVFSDRVYEI